MTDEEQIIIDGKGCRYKTWDKDCALTGDNHGDNMKPCKFIDEKNCYYKQLACKTQECEKLNNEIIDMNSIIEDAAINLGNKDFTLYDLPFEIKKLSQECENLKAEEKYLKQCCQKAGEELAKYSFEYDGKEKNLVVQAIELNEKYEKLKKALEKIEEITKINCEEICGRKLEDCNDFLCISKNILYIINKAKGGK